MSAQVVQLHQAKKGCLEYDLRVRGFSHVLPALLVLPCGLSGQRSYHNNTRRVPSGTHADIFELLSEPRPLLLENATDSPCCTTRIAHALMIAILVNCVINLLPSVNMYSFYVLKNIPCLKVFASCCVHTFQLKHARSFNSGNKVLHCPVFILYLYLLMHLL